MRIEEKFREVAKEFPRKLAVSWGKHSFTYKELDHESDLLTQIAETPGKVVTLERSPNFPLYALAVWKAGKVVALNRAPELTEPLDDDAAFLCETSGTTGEPKWIVATHRATCAAALIDSTLIGLWPGIRFGNHRASMGLFHEMVSTFTSAGTFVMFPGEDKISLRVWLTSELIEYFATLPSTLRWICQGVYKFPDVKYVDVGGEPSDWGDVKLARETFPIAHFHHRYASNESHIIARSIIRHDAPLGEGRLPVGVPLPGVIVKIVDDKDKTGVAAGEIAVNSPFMNRYYGSPALNEHKFRGGYYHTRDVGYFRGDGLLVHCGRKETLSQQDIDEAEKQKSEMLTRIANASIGNL